MVLISRVISTPQTKVATRFFKQKNDDRPPAHTELTMDAPPTLLGVRDRVGSSLSFDLKLLLDINKSSSHALVSIHIHPPTTSCLEPKCPESFLLLLQKGLVELVDDCNGEKNSRSGTNGTHKIGNDRQGTNAHSTKGGGSGNVAIQNVNQGRITMTLHDHLIVSKLLGDISCRCTRHFNPSLGKECTRRQDEYKIKDSMERIINNCKTDNYVSVYRQCKGKTRMFCIMDILSLSELGGEM